MARGDLSERLESALPSGIMNRAGERFRRFLCGLHGHDALLHFEDGRISLMCTSCTYESPGWEVRESPQPPGTVAARVGAVAFASEHRAA
jgi:hypothetical protein